MTDTFTYDEPEARAAFGTLFMDERGAEPVEWAGWKENMERINEMFPTAHFLVRGEYEPPGNCPADSLDYFKENLCPVQTGEPVYPNYGPGHDPRKIPAKTL